MEGNINQQRIAAIIQARIGSKRLPGKVLLKLGHQTVLEILITRLKRASNLDEIVIATTNKHQDEGIITLSKDMDINCFRGSENDVLDRYYKAANEYKADLIVRITADNPLTDINLISHQIQTLLREKVDYLTTKAIILGLNSEVFSAKALNIAWKKAYRPHQREHVTPYFYEHPEIFKITFLPPPNQFKRKDIRLTIDTPADFKLFQHLYRHFGDLTKIDINEVIKFLDKNPSIKEINSNVKQKHYMEV